MLITSCCGGCDSVRNALVLGSCSDMSFSICVNVVAAMKKISRLKTMSVSGTRLKGSSDSETGSLIRMGDARRRTSNIQHSTSNIERAMTFGTWMLNVRC